jgi:hypothetical protein
MPIRQPSQDDEVEVVGSRLNGWLRFVCIGSGRLRRDRHARPCSSLRAGFGHLKTMAWRIDLDLRPITGRKNPVTGFWGLIAATSVA